MKQGKAMPGSACWLCEPEWFDGAREQVPAAVLCAEHEGHALGKLLVEAENKEKGKNMAGKKMKRGKTKEVYFAIRIGDPGLHATYFMLGPDGRTPALFANLGDATAELAKELAKQPATTIVMVEVKEQ